MFLVPVYLKTRSRQGLVGKEYRNPSTRINVTRRRRAVV